jgi:hypothetical protein
MNDDREAAAMPSPDFMQRRKDWARLPLPDRRWLDGF